MTTCAQCGRPTDDHRRHVRFVLPDPVLDVPPEERAERTWGNDVLMQVDGIGAFVRVLVPVRLTGGYTMTYGAWLGVHPDDLKHAYEVWLSPAYTTLRLEGRLANGLPPWEDATFGRPLSASVRDADEAPYAAGSDDAFLRRVLTEEWPHDEVLAGLPE